MVRKIVRLCNFFKPLIPGGNKRSYVLNQNLHLKLQVCLSMHDLLLPPGINGLKIVITIKKFTSLKKLQSMAY